MSGAWPERGSPTFPGSVDLAAGVVAHNEEHHLRSAVQSLVGQELPEGVRWKEIWVVASGCTDRTVEVARSLADEEPRVRVVVEAERTGKARALREVFRRASGDALVLLNSDARAEPGAVGRLVGTAVGKRPPFAIMARPVVPSPTPGRWAPTFEWMWDLHHEFHVDLLARGNGAHLSDELLLVSLPSVPPVPDGIINDGSYFAVWLSQHAGGLWYAPDARVSIQVPSNVRDHLRQRRRIHVGNAQVSSVLGAAPATIPRRLVEEPAETVRLLRRMLAREDGFEHFARLATWELVAHLLAAWDRLPPRKDHVRWERIRSSPPETTSAPGASAANGSERPSTATDAERRIAVLLRVAGQFGTGVPLGHLQELLPAGGPETVGTLGRWLEEHPSLARLAGARAFAPTATVTPNGDRARRAHQYRQFADSLWNGPLSFGRELVRCAGITGSVAFGEPGPGDDLDLFIVTRSGALWWFLARAYLAMFVARRRDPPYRGPTPCLNYVLEDRAAALEFARRSDLMFAREALSVQVLHGDEYYRGLIASGPWMRAEIPRLYDSRSQAPGTISSEPAPRSVRLLNLVIYPILATYLHLAGLVRNAGARRLSDQQGSFRTETTFRRLTFHSRRFETLRGLYHGSSSARAVPERGAGSSRGPAT